MAVAVTGNTAPVITVRAIVTGTATGTADWTTTRPLRVFDVVLIKTNGAGAGNTVRVRNVANNITDDMACAVDTTITRPATLDDANELIATGGTLRIVATFGAGTNDCEAYIHCVGA